MFLETNSIKLMQPSDYALIAGAIVAILGTVWASIKWILSPHLAFSMIETIKDTVGQQIQEVPKLTLAVDRLTQALERQSGDTKQLNATIEKLDEKIQDMAKELGLVSGRTAVLEATLPSIESTAKAAAEVVSSTAKAAAEVIATANEALQQTTSKKKNARTSR